MIWYGAGDENIERSGILETVEWDYFFEKNKMLPEKYLMNAGGRDGLQKWHDIMTATHSSFNAEGHVFS